MGSQQTGFAAAALPSRGRLSRTVRALADQPQPTAGASASQRCADRV